MRGRPIVVAFGCDEWLSRNDLVARGVSRNRLAPAVRAGVLVEQHHNLYRLGCRPLGAEAALSAALRAAGPGAVASHRSAAHVWGLVEAPGPQPVITVPRSSNPRLADVVVHRTADPVRPMSWHGVAVTDPLRTVVDAAATEAAVIVDEMVDTGLRRRLFDVSALLAEASRLARPGREGPRALRDRLAERALIGAPPPSELERRGRALLERHGIAIVGAEVVVLGGRYRVDLMLEQHVVVELLGYAWHWSPEAMAADLARVNELALAGLRVFQFPWRTVVDQPTKVVATCRRALADR